MGKVDVLKETPRFHQKIASWSCNARNRGLIFRYMYTWSLS